MIQITLSEEVAMKLQKAMFEIKEGTLTREQVINFLIDFYNQNK